MGEIPGARARLDREVAAVFDCLRSLAELLTPGQVPDLAVPREPFRDGGTVPATYHYSAVHRVDAREARPPRSAYGPELAFLAGGFLRADGWVTSEGTRRPGTGAGSTVVNGERGGARVGVSVAHDRSSVLYTGRTSAVALYEPEPHVRPEPVVTARTLSSGYALCYECDGLGWCPACEGQGWVLGSSPGPPAGPVPRDPHRLGLCPLCSARRICPVCRGAGQLYDG
ncbi:hypothetical protein ACFWUZ_12140 [Streptomyces sp. NPDC058646]|uniref:hypothetical protein n=1 Tax=Streptomyces sp. NPDC058646 TaxID=3346574 RepID=UPI003662789C